MDVRARCAEFLKEVSPSSWDDRIVLCQMQELKKQTPLLYALLVVNAGAVTYTHYAFAPGWMTIGVLAFLGLICGARAVWWMRLDVSATTPAECRRRLRTTTVLTGVISAAFISWSMELGRYGGPFEQAHVASFVAITVIGCIFCLMHLPTAALLVTCLASVPFLFYYLPSGNDVLIAITLNTAFVVLVMVRVLINNFTTFVQLIESRATLADKQDETQRLMEENVRLAHTDSLTQLPNRRFFFLRLDEMISAGPTDGSGFALAIFDLDRFKAVNDTYGHVVGDRVLAETGRRLLSLGDDRIVAARLGGDEFGVLLRVDGPPGEAVAVCRRICEALRQPIDGGETVVTPGCSSGLALFPQAARTAGELFDRADYALYHSKEKARGAVTLFSPDHEDAIRSERAVETALQISDLEAEMEVHFQPILDLSTDRIVMVEALARWNNPLLGRVPPDRFIAAAERCGLIHKLTLLLLRKALADLKRLPDEIGLSFNLSSHDLTSPETVVAIMAAVRRSEIPPTRLTLELTETALLRDFDLAQRSIQALRALGIQIALDDFGTGYSSLGYVHRLTLDKIKIDRSFMSDIAELSGQSIVATVLHLSQNLSLQCIAEGVETEAQLAALRRLGCRFVQGYLIGAPAPIDRLNRLWTPAMASAAVAVA